MLCNFYFTTSCSKVGMGVGRAPHHCLVNVEGTRFPSEDSTQPVLTTHRGWGHWRGWQVLPLALGSCSLLATLSKDMGRPRKPSAGTIKQCRAISLSLSPPLGGFHHSNLQRAKSSARGTAGALAHLLCTEFFHGPREHPRDVRDGTMSSTRELGCGLGGGRATVLRAAL